MVTPTGGQIWLLMIRKGAATVLASPEREAFTDAHAGLVSGENHAKSQDKELKNGNLVSGRLPIMLPVKFKLAVPGCGQVAIVLSNFIDTFWMARDALRAKHCGSETMSNVKVHCKVEDWIP